jgi:ATP phosphoribosyltransferase
LRVATKYKNLTNNFFSKCGVVDYRTVESDGSTESAPFNGFSEIITDITSTGETLRANNLRVLDDGIILKSSANIFSSKVAEWDNEIESNYKNFINKFE